MRDFPFGRAVLVGAPGRLVKAIQTMKRDNDLFFPSRITRDDGLPQSCLFEHAARVNQFLEFGDASR